MIDQSDDDLAVASVIAAFDQRNVAVADVFVDHRITFDAQRIDSFWSHSAKQKTRDANHLDVLHCVDGRSRGNTTNQPHFANGVRRRFFQRHGKTEMSRLMFAPDESALFQSGNMFRDRRF